MGSENNMVAVRDEVARIIDPYSFCDVPFTDDPALLDMVEQSKGDALRKADRILARLAQPDAQQGEAEGLRAEVERLRGLLVDPGSPPWEDARAILVAELRKMGFDTHADNVAAGEGVMLPSYVALNLIALCHRAQQGASSPASGEGVAIPAGMKQWPSDGEAPADWDKSAPIQDANGDIVMPRHTARGMWHTVACYTPLAAATQPAVPQEVTRWLPYIKKGLDIAETLSGDVPLATHAIKDLNFAMAAFRNLSEDLAALTGAGDYGEQGA